ncbi:MAG: TAXI family TRAP transporter solute-binding subunit [Pirellulales bacterium]|nr:TAXI family TRAP transporter solute-binding subunit [Pirellulales bacterium]
MFGSSVRQSKSKSQRGKLHLFGGALLSLVLFVGCGDGERTEFVNIGTAPAAGSFHPVGSAMASTFNGNKPEGGNWKAQAKGTKGSQENIRLLDQGELQLALSNCSISYFAARGESGWEKAYPIRTVMTLAPNVAMFVTRADSGIKTMDQLKGKNVVIGPPGAGFEQFVGPILEEHGLSFEDFTVKHLGQGPAVSALGDGTVDAAFLGGSVPVSSITQACSTMDVHFIPFDDDAYSRLVAKYPSFHEHRDLTADDYSDISGTFKALNVGAMHLITSESADEELVYQMTKTIYERFDEFAGGHASLKMINKEKDVTLDTGVEFHPGAIRFYKEQEIWPN